MTDDIAVRLTGVQMSLIWPGLDFIVKAHVSRREHKGFHREYPFRVYPVPIGFDRGTQQPAMMEQIIGIWRRLRPKASSGGRIQLNAIELRALAFAVRVNLGLWRQRRRAARRWSPETKARMQLDKRTLKSLQRRSQQVIGSLERHMKRANRLLRMSVSDDDYKALMEVWREHLRWMRLHLVYFRPSPPVLHGRKARLQRAIDDLVDMAAHGIRSEGYEPPDAVELRRLMRLFARSSRRGREGYHTVASVLDDKKSFNTKWYLARFVLRRLDLKRLP